MINHNKRLPILSESEWLALYALPDFNDAQRAEYLTLNKQELRLVYMQPNPEAQVYCALQLGYFKAKRAFFVFSWPEASADMLYVLETCFPDLLFCAKPVTRRQYYTQRNAIIGIYGFSLWSKDFELEILSIAHQLAKQDITPRFIISKVLAYLGDRKIVRPSYRVLQDLVSQAIIAERNHLYRVVRDGLDKDTHANLQSLLAKDENLLGLATLKQDAKNFNFAIMAQERQKVARLKPMYLAAKQLVPKFGISQQNVDYYASLVDYYTIYELRRFDIHQTYLYLLCYIFKRYQQVNDTIAEGFCYSSKQFDNTTKEQLDQWRLQQRQDESRVKKKLPRAGELLLLYLAESFGDETPFGKVRQHAFSILSKEEIRITAEQMNKPSSDIDAKWKIIDKQAALVKKRLRPLVLALDFSSTTEGNHSIEALAWIKQVFSKGKRLCEQPLEHLPSGAIPKKLRPYLLSFDEQGQARNLRDDRFEFWLYRRLRKRLLLGELCLKDSVRHRAFEDGLVPLEQKETLLQNMNLLWLRQSIEDLLDSKLSDLDKQWLRFNKELKQGKLKHLEYDTKKQSWRLRKSKANTAQEVLDDKQQLDFYGGLPFVDIADVLRFANENCNFLSAFSPLLPRAAQNVAHEDNLLASILAVSW